jgi:hypothetical protein
MLSRWGWVRTWALALMHALGIGRVGAAAVVLAPGLEVGARYRLRLLVQSARETLGGALGANGARLGIAHVLEAAGWGRVRVYTDRAELDPDWWAAEVAADSVRAPAWRAWAEGTWTGGAGGGASPFVAELDEGVRIMHVEKTIALLLEQTAPAVPPPPPLPRVVAARAVVPAIGALQRDTRPEVRLTSHLPWEFFEGLRDGCYARGWKPRGLLMVMNSESSIRSTAHNANGNAVGLIQFMPSTLRDLRFVPSADAARGREPWQVLREDFGPVAQLELVFRYYDSRSPRLVADPDETAFYLATYHPAHNAHAGEPGFVLTRAPSVDYAANAGAFDAEGRGWIQVSDLTRRIRATAVGAFWQEASARLQYVEDEGGGGGGVAAALARAGAAVGMLAIGAGLAWVGYQVAEGFPAFPVAPSRLPA